MIMSGCACTQDTKKELKKRPCNYDVSIYFGRNVLEANLYILIKRLTQYNFGNKSITVQIFLPITVKVVQPCDTWRHPEHACYLNCTLGQKCRVERTLSTKWD